MVLSRWRTSFETENMDILQKIKMGLYNVYVALTPLRKARFTFLCSVSLSDIWMKNKLKKNVSRFTY